MPRPKQAAKRNRESGAFAPGPVTTPSTTQATRAHRPGSSGDTLEVFDPDDPYTVQRRLLRLLVAGELAITDEAYSRAMGKGFAIIEGWLASKSPKIRARGLRALTRWRQGYGRAAALASQAARLDQAEREREHHEHREEGRAATLAELMDTLDAIRAEQARQAAAVAVTVPEAEPERLPEPDPAGACG